MLQTLNVKLHCTDHFDFKLFEQLFAYIPLQDTDRAGNVDSNNSTTVLNTVLASAHTQTA
jgi:hypothetical protein